MTATQAPTPGPLSGDDEMLYARAIVFATRDKPSTSYLQRRVQIGFNLAASLFERMEKEGLISKANSAGKRTILVPFSAPTAPVEASGSDLTDLLERLRTIDNGTVKERPWIATELCDEAANALEALRPQPSGETRESVARLTAGLKNAHPNHKTMFVYVDDLRQALALLSARPLAFGGQQGVSGFTSVTGLWKDQNLSRLERVKAHRSEFGSELKQAVEAVDEEAARQALASKTTPARAEAQDEGAAGEPVAWRKWTSDDHPPYDGEWFVAKSEYAVRIVHYADKHDRLPIDHTDWAWPSVPTHWLKLSDFYRLHPSPTPAADAPVAWQLTKNGEPIGGVWPYPDRKGVNIWIDGECADDVRPLYAHPSPPPPPRQSWKPLLRTGNRPPSPMPKGCGSRGRRKTVPTVARRRFTCTRTTARPSPP